MVLPRGGRIPGIPSRTPHGIDSLLDSHASTLTTHTSSISALDARADGHDTDITTLDGRVDGHDTDLAPGSPGDLKATASDGVTITNFTPGRIAATLRDVRTTNTAAENDTAITALVAEAVAAGSPIDFGPGEYVFDTPLPLQSGITYEGVGSGDNETARVPTTLTRSDNAEPIFAFVDNAPAQNRSIDIRHLRTTGGLHGVAMQEDTRTTFFTMDDVTIVNPQTACVFIDTPSLLEEWRWNRVGLIGGDYGVKATVGRWDKSTFIDVETKNQDINCWNIDLVAGSDVRYVGVSWSLSWINPIFHHPGEHGLVATADGSARNWAFYNLYSEGVGNDGKNDRTTGSVSASSTSLTVASATGYETGDSITIAGAGASGADHTTTVAGVSGTTITLDDAASTTVADAKVTNAAFDTFSFGTGMGELNFYAPYLGDEGTGGNVRYAMDLSNINFSVIIISPQTVQGTDKPIYDPNGAAIVLGRGVVRRPVGTRSGRQTVTGSTDTDKLASLIAALTADGIVIDGTS